VIGKENMANMPSSCLAISTSSRNTWAVILVVPDSGLQQLIASAMLMAQAWPGAWEEVMLFIQVLRMSVPSLAEVLKIGLITVLTTPADETTAQISLGYGTAVLTAIAGGKNGDRVPAPHLRPVEVWRLEITDLTVDGLSGLRLAG
jgi:hypothetical protein